MVHRLSKLSKSNSFFLFGARGTGKSTLLKSSDFLKNAFYIDLLNSELQESYSLNPMLLEEEVAAKKKLTWVVIDEVQKNPKLLDSVHRLIESKKILFALTGSSSRKLKRGGANLLAGRAFLFSLFPFTHIELQDRFNLQDALNWGTLPKLYELSDDEDKARYLRSYVHTYLREEIQIEQLVRNLDPFRLFLPISAQMDGHPINYSNISKDTGVDYKTIQNYFQILVETNLGFFLEPFEHSVRKVQIQSPKFYYFDLGVKRALTKRLNVPLQPGSEYGMAFESWFINECFRLNEYFERDFQFSYLKTKDDAEIDLIVSRPGDTQVLVEIKSSNQIDGRHLKHLKHFSSSFPEAEKICACQVPQPRKHEDIWVLPWKEALKELFKF